MTKLNLSNFAKNISAKLGANAPGITIGLGTGAILVAGVMVGVATPKAMKLIEDAQVAKTKRFKQMREKAPDDAVMDETDELTWVEIIKAGWKPYAPAIMTAVVGVACIVEGVGTNAHGDVSHAEGSGSEAIGFTSHSEGNSTVASGTYSHAEGDNTVASGEASHAAGRGTIADNDAQTAIGRYNLKNSSNLFSVGNGTSDESRSNAFAVGTDGQTFASSNTHTKGNFVTDENNHGVYLRRTDGTTAQELLLDSGNNLSIGYGQWENGNGTVLRAGSDISFGIKNYGATVYRPYYRKGDSLTMEWRGAGYVTASSSMVWFVIPFSKPVIGNPTVTVTSVNGLILRQNGKYICGTAASTWKKPSSIQCSRYADFLYIGCKMSATTNAVNNDSVGIEASIKITFS